MSNISTRHNVNLFVSGESKPLTGQRLAKVGYKTSKKTPAKFPSVCISVPQIDTKTDPFLEFRNGGKFDSIIRDALESAQDGIIKSLYESSGGQLSSVGDDDICLNACLAFIEAENSGGRLTKEFLEAWFDTNVAENLTVVVADKLGFDDLTDSQMEVIQKHLNGYKALVSSLSGGATILNVQQQNNILRALDIAACDDDTSAKLRARIRNMSEKKNIEELLEL